MPDLISEVLSFLVAERTKDPNPAVASRAVEYKRALDAMVKSAVTKAVPSQVSRVVPSQVSVVVPPQVSGASKTTEQAKPAPAPTNESAKTEPPVVQGPVHPGFIAPAKAEPPK